MSLARLVYYSGVIGGWAALLGWIIAEVMFFRSGQPIGRTVVALVSGIVGATVGASLTAVAGLSNAHWRQLLARAIPGLICGAAGGAIGGFIGDFLYESLGFPRAIGWAAVGLGIGIGDGLYEKSQSKIRNGLIGGTLGGLVGGLLFDPIQRLIASGSGMSARATAFVILGICIGAMIGLAQVVLKHAWLTVVDGYRNGRQLILGQSITMLGRAEHLPLPFLGPHNQELELEHAKIMRQPDGSFILDDNHSKIGTRLNNQPLQAPVLLRDGDVIKLGKNSIRFNERQRRADDSISSGGTAKTVVVAAPPPPPRKAAATAPIKSSESATNLPRTSIASMRPISPPTGPSSPAPGAKRGSPPPPPPPRRPKSSG